MVGGEWRVEITVMMMSSLTDTISAAFDRCNCWNPDGNPSSDKKDT